MLKKKIQVRDMLSQFVFYGDSNALFFIFLMKYNSDRLSELIFELFGDLEDSKNQRFWKVIGENIVEVRWMRNDRYTYRRRGRRLLKRF